MGSRKLLTLGVFIPVVFLTALRLVEDLLQASTFTSGPQCHITRHLKGFTNFFSLISVPTNNLILNSHYDCDM